jgi:hypothetical protein
VTHFKGEDWDGRILRSRVIVTVVDPTLRGDSMKITQRIISGSGNDCRSLPLVGMTRGGR